MSLLTMKSKFASICKLCKVKIQADETIYKVNEHWCSNQNCPNQKTVQPKIAAPDLPEYAKLHFEIWKFAYASAEKIHTGNDFESKKSRNILAQVFYKKCFDARIHGVRQK